MSLISQTVSQLSQMLANKECSSYEIINEYLKEIGKDQNHEQPLNAYITVTPEEAINGAKLADQRIKDGNNTVLTGIPLGVKDLINVKNIPTTCASKILTGYISPYDATVIRKLIREEGMPHLGKLNLDEFAMGSSNETSYYGIVRNPANKNYSPGGSSGGSAAAVAGNLAPITLGTDTGGSIRQPAAFCGCVGFKPTYGRVSRYGATAFASSLDQIGPIARSVEDASMLYTAMSGFDPYDTTTVKKEVSSIKLNSNIKGLKIGLPKEFFVDVLDEEIKIQIMKIAKALEKEGAIISEVSIPEIKHAPAAYYIIGPAEAATNLERFDGVRYGSRVIADTLTETYIKSRTEGFGSEVKRRIMLGTFILSSESYDDYFIKAQKVRGLLIDEYIKSLNEVDLLLGPTTPTTAFKIGEKSADPISMYLNDIFTIFANLVGAPSISIPIGNSKTNNMPIGLQLTAQLFDEEKLLNCAYAIELLN